MPSSIFKCTVVIIDDADGREKVTMHIFSGHTHTLWTCIHFSGLTEGHAVAEQTTSELQKGYDVGVGESTVSLLDQGFFPGQSDTPPKLSIITISNNIAVLPIGGQESECDRKRQTVI